jgi:hypothetical protein
MSDTQVTTVYDMDYFSGSQMFLYIGDVWIDEVTSLQYECTQRKTPIYGYASQLWDDVAAGQVLIQGAFTINFKEQGYLWSVLRRYKNMSSSAAFAGSASGGASKADKQLMNIINKDHRDNLDRRPVWGSNVDKIQRMSIERIVQGETTKGDAYKFYQDLAGYASYNKDIKGKAKDLVWEDIVEEFEDQIWSADNTNEKLKEQVRRTDHNLFDNFDMYIVFGNYAVRGANHTVAKLIDVRLTSRSKIIKVGGEPIQEAYQFIAQSEA